MSVVIDSDQQLRIARNEAVLREVNEAIEKGHWPGDEHAPSAFRCECGQLGCTQLVSVPPAEYQRIRAHPRRFIIAPDHRALESERVVSTHGGYAVVEKLDEPGRLAEATDPRT